MFNASLLNRVHFESILLMSVVSSSSLFLHQSHILTLPSLSVILLLYYLSCHSTIFFLCHLSYLLPSYSSISIPLPLKPEGLSRSAQITSLRLGICFQSCPINQTSLGIFSFFFILLYFSPFLSFSPFPSVSFLHGAKFKVEDHHSLCVIQIETVYNCKYLFPSLREPLNKQDIS